MTSMTNDNKSEYKDFEDRYEKLINETDIKYHSNAIKQKNKLKEKIQKKYDELLRDITDMQKYKNKDIFDDKKIIGSKISSKIPASGKYNDRNAGMNTFDIDININIDGFISKYPNDYNQLINIYKKLKNDEKFDSKAHIQMLDWKSLDPYQLPIGSIYSLTEFFFNMMMVYNNNVIFHINKSIPNLNQDLREADINQSDWYVYIPDIWKESILNVYCDSSNDEFKKLIKYGISVSELDDVYFYDHQNNTINKSYNGDFASRGNIDMHGRLAGGLPNYTACLKETRSMAKNNYTCAKNYISAIYQNDLNLLYDSGNNYGALSAMNYGVFMTPFIVDYPNNMNYSLINNNFFLDTDFIGQLGNAPISSMYGGINYLNNHNVPYYDGNFGGALPNNSNINFVSYYVGYQSRFLYDIIYSNPIGDNFGNTNVNGEIRGNKVLYSSANNMRAGSGHIYNPIIKDLYGGYVTIFGDIPCLDRNEPKYQTNFTTKHAGAITTIDHRYVNINRYEYGFLIDNGNNYPFMNTARQTYNYFFTNKINVLTNDAANPIIIYDINNTSKFYKTNKFDATGGIAAGRAVTPLSALGASTAIPFYFPSPNAFSDIDYPGNDDIVDIISKTNFGGYFNDNYINPNSATRNIDPIGFIRCRDLNKNINEIEKVIGENLVPPINPQSFFNDIYEKIGYTGRAPGNLGNFNDVKPMFLNNDSIVSEGFIYGVISKLTDIIFGKLPNIRGILNSQFIDYFRNKDTLKELFKEQFKYRLARSIITIRKAIFEIPIPEKYKIITEFEKFKKNSPASPFSNQIDIDSAVKNIFPGGEYDVSYEKYETYLNNNNKSQMGKDIATGCKGQPITICQTKEFLNGFKNMIDKAIICRSKLNETILNFNEIDSSKIDNYTETDILKATGICKYLIDLDIFEILNVKIYDDDNNVIFHMYEYLADMLNSEYNISQMHLKKSYPSRRKMTAGFYYITPINQYDEFDKLYLYLNKLFDSKNILLGRIDDIDNIINKKIKLKFNEYRKQILAVIDKIFNPINGTLFLDDLINNDKDRIKNKLLFLETVYIKNIKDLSNLIKNYEDRYKEYQSKMESIKMQINKKNINTEQLISIGDIESQRIEKSRNETKEKYITLRINIIAILEELNKYIIKLESLTLPDKEKKIDLLNDIKSKFLRIGKENIFNFNKQDFNKNSLYNKSIKKYAYLDKYSDALKKDQRIDVDKPISDKNIDKRNVGLWIIYKYSYFGINNYGLLNLINGTRIERIDKTINNISSRKKDIDLANFRGVIIINNDGFKNNFYYAPSPPQNTNINSKEGKNNLRDYRENIFKNFPDFKKKTPDNIIPDNLIKIIYAYSDYYKDDINKITYTNNDIIHCNPVNICKRLITLKRAKDIIDGVISQYVNVDNTQNVFKNVISAIERKNSMKGGNKRKSKIKFI